MATSTNGGSTASFSNAPQATGDLFTATGLTEDCLKVVTLDVMANDLGGNAKTLWSLDNDTFASGTAPADLLIQDTGRLEASSGDTSASGAKIWITSDGKVGYDATTLSGDFKAQLQALQAGQTLTDTFTYAIRLGNGTLSWATAKVQFTGANDAPVMSLAGGDHDSAALTETNSGLAADGHLTASDVDATDHVMLSVNSAAVNPTSTGATALDAAALKQMFTVNADGTWHFNSGSEAFNSLAAGQKLVLDYTVKADDGHGGSDQHTITITILGTNDAAVLSADTANLTETNAVLSTSGTLTISDVDSAQTFVAQAGTAGTYGTFAIDSAGAWSYTASSAHNEFVGGTTYTDTFSVASADGTLTSVTVNILGTNDAAVLSADTANLTETNAVLSTSGTLTISDVDSAQTFVAQAGTAGTYGTFAIDSAGAWSYTASSAHNEFVGGTTYTDTFSVASADGTLTSVTVNILGTNDAAVLSADTANLTETNAVLSTSGTLTISDVDSAQTFVAQAGTAGSYGTFAIDSAGAWSYTASSAHNEFVGGTTYTDTFSVASADGTLTSVTVNILGTNDAAVLSADTANLTETNAVLSTSGTLTISDVDSAQTFVAQAGTAGTYGTFAIDSAGAWSYTASSAHNEFVGGTTYTDTFSVASADGTLTSVTVNILGTNDAAVLSADTANLTETNAVLSTSGTLTISDVDSAQTFVAQAGTAGTYGTFAIDSAGAWSYTASSAHNEFVGGTTYTDTFSVASADGTLTSVTVNILGTNDAAVLSADTANLTETNAVLSTSGTLTISDVDSAQTFVAQAGTAGTYGTFAIDSAGAWSYTASSAHNEFVGGTTYTDTFSVASADGTLTSVTVNILGTNDAAVLSADTANLTETNAVLSTSGTLTISDVDSAQTFVAQAGTAGTYGTFAIDSAGAWSYTASSAHNEFVGGTTYTDTFSVASADGTLTSVTVNILGTNDAAVLSADTANLTETNAVLSTSGTLTISDVDSAQTFVAQAGTAGTYGTFAIDSAGAWSYTASSAHNEFVGGTTYTDTFSVASADGTLTSVTVNILGTNDAAVLSADTANLTETNAVLSTSGTLTISDVDSAQTFVAQAGTAGTYGTFAIDSAGAWSYTASSAHNEFVGGTTYTDTFSVASADGTLTSVTVNILGTNDAAVLSADTANLTETNAVLSTSGTLTISDVDSAQTFVAQAGTAGTYGTFAIDSAGAWSYTASSAHNEFVGGTTYTDTFSVASADGTLTSVTVNILGTNDAAVLSADTANLTETNAVLSTSGTLTISDVDSAQTFVAQAGTAGTYGTFAIDSAGAWSYTASSAHNEFVGGTTYTDTFSVASADGTLTSVTVNILGTNDAAVLSADTANLTETNAVLSTSGTLTISDVDSAQTFVAQAGTAGTYGTFAIDSAGAWSYTASSAHNEFVGGTTYTDTFSVASADGTLTSVTVTILGTNDAPVALADAKTATQGTPLTFQASDLTANDTDVDGDSLTVTAVNGASHGSISLSSGQVTYTPSTGFSGSDSFNYVISDGHGGTASAAVSVMVQGGVTDLTSGNDSYPGGSGNDTINGLSGDDTISGGDGNDSITGGSGSDSLSGGPGNDTIDGGNQQNTIVGGLGNDSLTGGNQADRYVYGSPADSPDTITGFQHGADKIDLFAIDANPTITGDQAFTFNGTTATAHGIWYTESGGSTTLMVDIDGITSTHEMEIVLVGTNLKLDNGDFML